MRLTIPAVAAACAFSAFSPSAQARPPAEQSISLASHRAIYNLQMAESAGNKAPANASGRIAFEFASGCEGYNQTLRQVLDMEPSEGPRQITETRTSTFEDARGVDFRFNIAAASGKNGEVDGHAARDARGVSIALTRPEPFRIKTEHDVLFPTQHIAKVIESARRGEKIFLARVYDGSDDGRKIFDVTTIIGKPRKAPDKDKGAQDRNLRGLARWPVALAYFPPDRQDGLPDYVLSFNLYENGVSTGLKLDYGDFVLRGELVRIEFPPAHKCGR